MKYTFRLVPCSIYENEIMESWLEDQALNGLALENISCGIAKFRKEESQKIRYCMSIIPAERWDVYEWIPGKSAFIDLCEASGWKFICQRGQFGIFMTTDESVAEMHTEPELQYLDYKDYVDWRVLIGYGFMFLVMIYHFRKVLFLQQFFDALGMKEILLVIALFLITIANLFMAGRLLFCPLMLYRRLKKEGIQHKHVPWRKSAFCYRFVRVVISLIYIVGFAYAISYLIIR